MNAESKPEFPFQLVWCQTGEVEAFEDPKDLILNLEDFDSDDPADRTAAKVTDARGRPVHLVVKIWTGTCAYRLDDGDR